MLRHITAARNISISLEQRLLQGDAGQESEFSFFST
jgi:hypothetical protein